jgi:hypothetical protein
MTSVSDSDRRLVKTMDEEHRCFALGFDRMGRAPSDSRWNAKANGTRGYGDVVSKNCTVREYNCRRSDWEY